MKTVKLCSGKLTPFRTGYHEEQGTLAAHFSLFGGKQCPFKDQCSIKFNKKDAVLRIDRKSILAAQEREKLNCKKVKRENTSKRTAIEEAISAIKEVRTPGD